MTDGEAGNYCLELLRHAMDSPIVGLAVFVTAMIVSCLSLAKQRQQFARQKPSIAERISEFSSP